MEKLKRLQEGADLDELLAEMDEEFPEDEEEEEDYDEELEGLTEVQKKVSIYRWRNLDMSIKIFLSKNNFQNTDFEV